MNIIISIILGILLLICSIQDGFLKKINIWIVISGGILLCPFLWFSSDITIMERIFGLITGAGVIMLSRATKGKIGMGDGLILCITGLALGFWRNMELFAIALFGAAIISIILLVFKRVDRKKSIPFIPFLLFGHVILCFV